MSEEHLDLLATMPRLLVLGCGSITRLKHPQCRVFQRYPPEAVIFLGIDESQLSTSFGKFELNAKPTKLPSGVLRVGHRQLDSGLALKILFRGLSFVVCAIGGVFALWTVVWIVLGISFKPSIPYFEAFLNQKYKGYKSTEGRVIRCESWTEYSSEYEISCRYFRQAKAEEPTYHAFDKWGGYIGSRDGG